MHVELAAVPVEHLLAEEAVAAENSAAVAARVGAARRLQIHRQGRLGLSARAYHRLLKVARTCADLAAEGVIRRGDVAEAMRLRALG